MRVSGTPAFRRCTTSSAVRSLARSEWATYLLMNSSERLALQSRVSAAEIMNLFQPGDHGSTFGGNPLGAAIAEVAMDVIVDEKLPERARYAGAAIMQGLRAVRSPYVREIRGRGLMIGIELTRPAEELSRALLARGVAAKDTQENVLRIAPPLVIDDEAIATLLAAYRDAIGSL